MTVGYHLLYPGEQVAEDAPVLLDHKEPGSLIRSHQVDAASEARQAAGGQPVYLLVKGNPRGLDLQALYTRLLDTQAIACEPREGKRVWVWESEETNRHAQRSLTHRRIHRLAERTLDAQGRVLLVPEIEYDFWDTTLPESFPPSEVIELYADHGTHEQFHSELFGFAESFATLRTAAKRCPAPFGLVKTDLDLERLPSGKFDTNDLILSLACLAYNVLRLMGQSALLAEEAPIRHPAKRRRLKTVLQELIYVSAKLVAHARQKVLNFGRLSGVPGLRAFVSAMVLGVAARGTPFPGPDRRAPRGRFVRSVAKSPAGGRASPRRGGEGRVCAPWAALARPRGRQGASKIGLRADRGACGRSNLRIQAIGSGVASPGRFQRTAKSR